jgi:uncharacterized protein YdaU (DUF1376 family)
VNYYRRYPGDYARDTKHLTMLEHGAYTLLLDAYYATGKALCPTIGIVYRICNCTTQWERNAVKRVLAEFFTLESDGYHNGKADRIIKVEQPRIDAARNNGARGGRPRLHNPEKTQRVVDNKPS